MKIKHSKYKNTGILFELLVRQITADTLSGKSSPATGIMKNYFVKSELSKEYKLYETLTQKTGLTEGKADITINTLLETSKKLNRGTLRREKYNLIREIKKHYNLDEFFKTQLPHYRVHASFFILSEIYNQEDLINPTQIIDHKVTLLEHLTTKEVNKEIVKENVIEEFRSYDKDLRILTYRVLLEKFNGKYEGLNDNQKTVLKEFINTVDSTPTLREFYNTKIGEIKSSLFELNTKVDNPTIQIKINEVINILEEADKTVKINDDHLINLLQYYSLLEELEKANG
jgi:ABC-type cobalt transport system substrate-binding protein